MTVAISRAILETDLVEDECLVESLQHGTLEHDHLPRPRKAAGLGGGGNLGGTGEGGCRRGGGRQEARLHLYPEVQL